MSSRYTSDTGWFGIFAKMIALFIFLYLLVNFIPNAVLNRISKSKLNTETTTVTRTLDNSTDKSLAVGNLFNFKDFNSDELSNSVKASFKNLTDTIKSINDGSIHKSK